MKGFGWANSPGLDLGSRCSDMTLAVLMTGGDLDVLVADFAFTAGLLCVLELVTDKGAG